MSNKYYWLKLKDTFFDSIEMRKLSKINGGDAFIIIYLKLMLATIKEEGKYKLQGIEETIEAELALLINENVENVKICLGILKSLKLAEVSGVEIFLVQVPDFIGKTDDSKERVKRYREKKTLENLNKNNSLELQQEYLSTDLSTGKTEVIHRNTNCNALQNVTVTNCNDSVTECNAPRVRVRVRVRVKEELEKEVKEKEIFYFLENRYFLEAFTDYIEMRKKKRKQATERAKELILKQLHEHDIQTAIKMLEQSTKNSWTGIFDLKTNTYNNNKIGGKNNVNTVSTNRGDIQKRIYEHIDNWCATQISNEDEQAGEGNS